MLALVWSKEKQIKEEVIKAYWNLYLDESEYKIEGVANNIIELFEKAALTELISLEELLGSI